MLVAPLPLFAQGASLHNLLLLRNDINLWPCFATSSTSFSAAAPLRDVLRCCSASQYHQPLAPLRDVIGLLRLRDAWRPTYLRPFTQSYRMASILYPRWCAFGIHQFPGTTTGFMVFSGFEPHTTIVNSYHCSSPYGLPIVRPSQMGRCVKINFTSVTLHVTVHENTFTILYF